MLSTYWNWIRKYEYEVITYRLPGKHNCKTSANHILFHFLKNKQQTLGTSINNLTLSSICTKLKCNVLKACSPLHVYRYATEKSIRLGTVLLPTPKGIHSEKRQQTKVDVCSKHLYYVCQPDLPLSLWLTLCIGSLNQEFLFFLVEKKKQSRVDRIYDYTPCVSAKVLNFMQKLFGDLSDKIAPWANSKIFRFQVISVSPQFFPWHGNTT